MPTRFVHTFRSRFRPILGSSSRRGAIHFGAGGFWRSSTWISTSVSLESDLGTGPRTDLEPMAGKEGQATPYQLDQACSWSPRPFSGSIRISRGCLGGYIWPGQSVLLCTGTENRRQGQREGKKAEVVDREPRAQDAPTNQKGGDVRRRNWDCKTIGWKYGPFCQCEEERMGNVLVARPKKKREKP